MTTATLATPVAKKVRKPAAKKNTTAKKGVKKVAAKRKATKK